MAKSAGEARGRGAQAVFRTHPREASQVHDREEDVADLVLEGGRVPRLEGGRELGPLLIELREDAGAVGPVEPDASRALLELLRARERRQRGRDAGEHRGALALLRA